MNRGKSRETDRMEKERAELETILRGLRPRMSVYWVGRRPRRPIEAQIDGFCEKRGNKREVMQGRYIGLCHACIGRNLHGYSAAWLCSANGKQSF